MQLIWKCVIFHILFTDRTQCPESPVGAELPERLSRVPDPPKKVQQECHRLQREDAGDGTGMGCHGRKAFPNKSIIVKPSHSAISQCLSRRCDQKAQTVRLCGMPRKHRSPRYIDMRFAGVDKTGNRGACASSSCHGHYFVKRQHRGSNQAITPIFRASSPQLPLRARRRSNLADLCPRWRVWRLVTGRGQRRVSGKGNRLRWAQPRQEIQGQLPRSPCAHCISLSPVENTKSV